MQTSVTSQGFEYGVKHFLSPRSGPVAEIIQETLMLPSNEVLFLIQLGSVYVCSKRCDNPAASIQQDDHIRVHTKPRRFSLNIDWAERIVFNHSDFVVINKPSGLPSHPSVDNKLENSLTQAALALKENLLITHRLDTFTEGLIVYAKNNQFAQSFNRQLQNKLIIKKYVALVETTEKIPEHLVHYMEPSPRAPKTVSVVFHEDWDLCELKIEQQKILDSCSWVKINLLTGRTHQIRSQLSDMRAPILGDTLYGSQNKFTDQSIRLKAQEIHFNWQNQMHSLSLPEHFTEKFEP